MAQKFLNGIDVSSTTVVNGSNLDSGSTVLDVQGSQGQLFSVTNSLTGDLFSVSDISGIPILNVNSSGAVKVDGYIDGDLEVRGQLKITGDGSNAVTFTESGNGDFTIDAPDDIRIDAGGGDIVLRAAGTEFSRLKFNNPGLDIQSSQTNSNIYLTPNGTGNVYASTDTFIINAAEGEAASMLLRTDEGDNNGDDWYIYNGTDNILDFSNDISGSQVNMFTLTPHATASSSTATFAGKINAIGGSGHAFMLGNSDNTSTADTSGFRLHQSSYADGRYTHRFRKYDEGGGVPLYIDGSAGTANVFTALARFGAYTNESKTFEVFGTMGATNFSGSSEGVNTGDQVLPSDFVSKANGGTFDGNLTINIADTGNAPAMTSLLNLRGFEGRGAGIKIKDSANSDANPSNREWFIGSGYSQSGFNIGYSATGSQSSYAAQNKFTLTTAGNATFAGTVAGTNLSGTNTGDQDLSGYLTSLPSHNHDDRYYTETETNKHISNFIGWIDAYGTTESVSWNVTENAVQLQSDTDTSTGASYKARRVTAGEIIRVTLMVKASTAAGAGLYLRLYQHNGDMPDGKTHVSHNASASAVVVQEDDAQDITWYENGAVTTDWVTKERDYTVLADGYISVVVLNWTGIGTNSLYITTPDIQTILAADSNLLDGQEGTHYLDYSNFSGTPTIPTDFVSAANGGTFGGDLTIEHDSTPSLKLKDTTDPDLEIRIRAANSYGYFEVDNTNTSASSRLQMKIDGVNTATFLPNSFQTNTEIMISDEDTPGVLGVKRKNTGGAILNGEDIGRIDFVAQDTIDVTTETNVGRITLEADGDYSSTNKKSRFKFFVNTGTAIETALTIDSDKSVTIAGNLVVSGTTTTLNTATVEVEDNILQLNTTQAATDTATAATSGISIYRGVDENDVAITQASLIFDDGDDTWDLTNNLTVAGDVIGASFAVPSGASTGFLKADGTVDSSTYALASAIPTDFVSAANGGTFSGDVKFDGSLKWATSNSTSYTYSNADASGLYIETVGSTAALSDMRIQARAAGAGNYTSIAIKPSDQSILLRTNSATAVTLDSSQNAIFAGSLQVAETLSVGSGSSRFIWHSGNSYVSGSGTANATEIDWKDSTHYIPTFAYAFKVRLVVTGTGTDTGASYIVYYNNTDAEWKVRYITLAGTTSNHAQLTMVTDSTGSYMAAYHTHSGGYNIRYFVETFDSGDQDMDGHTFGSDFHWQRDNDTLSYSEGDIIINGSTDSNGAVTPRTLDFTTNPTEAGLAGSSGYQIGEISFTGKDSSTNASGKYGRIRGSIVDSNTTVQGSGGEGGKIQFTLLKHDAGAQPRVEYDILTLDPLVAEVDGQLDVTGNIRLIGGGTIEAPSTNGAENLILKAAGGVDVIIDTNGNGGDNEIFRVMHHTSTVLFEVQEGGEVRFQDGIRISGTEDRISSVGSSMYIGGGGFGNSLVQFSGKPIPDSSYSFDFGASNRYWNQCYLGTIHLKSTLLSNQENTNIDASTSPELVGQVAIATYTAAFFDFVVKKGTNIRSGTVYACHDGTNVEFTETSTNDLGDTSDVTLSVDISGANMRLLATVTSDDWSVKSLIRAI